MREFTTLGRLDYLVPSGQADPRLGFDALFQGEEGLMFGVLECRTTHGETVVLRAFSSLPGGIRNVEGWVPPLLDRNTYETVVLAEELRIKKITHVMEALSPDSQELKRLAEERRDASRDLMQRMFALYPLHNFRGESRSLRDAFAADGGIPGGAGECCAPKLLNHAAREGIRPVGLAEFYWGNPDRFTGRRQGEFYSPCETKCQPILGFLLCGLDVGGLASDRPGAGGPDSAGIDAGKPDSGGLPHV